MILLGLLALARILSQEQYRTILKATVKGMGITLFVSFIAFVCSVFIGLLIGLLRGSPSRIVREGALFYTELIRGIPMLVILYYIAFVGAPSLIHFLNILLRPLTESGVIEPLRVRDFGFLWRAVLALTIGYSAFVAEIFRAGIESIPRGQLEAAEALGLSRAQTMMRIVLPQAIRNVLPPLGNELVAMIKDSALVSVLGVADITQLGKVYSASSFQFFETYNVVALLYLILTVTLSLGVKAMEKTLARHKR